MQMINFSIWIHPDVDQEHTQAYISRDSTLRIYVSDIAAYFMETSDLFSLIIITHEYLDEI
jgi:hypothetical protein